jgi:GNAT superfamily N-acetyltransferase
VQLESPQEAQAAVLDGHPVWIAPARLEDLDALVDLHLDSFSEDEHFALQLGHPFIREAYGWLLTSPETKVLVARQEDRILGFTAFCNGYYNVPMLLACRRTVTLGLLRRPWLALRPEWLMRLVHPPWSRLKRLASSALGWDPPHRRKVAQIAFTALRPEAQGHGLGSALKQASIDVCRTWGVDVVITGVRRDNHRARLLNERAGFVEDPRQSTRRLIYLRLELKNPGANRS